MNKFLCTVIKLAYDMQSGTVFVFILRNERNTRRGTHKNTLSVIFDKSSKLYWVKNKCLYYLGSRGDDDDDGTVAKAKQQCANANLNLTKPQMNFSLNLLA